MKHSQALGRPVHKFWRGFVCIGMWMILMSAVVVPQSLYAQCVTPPSGMVAWWPLDEQSGATIVEDIVGSHDGTPSPGPIGEGGPAPIGGKVGGALYFWGNTVSRTYVSVNDQPDIRFGTTDFSIDAWVYITQYSGTQLQPIVEKMQYSGTTPELGYRFYLESGTLSFTLAWGLGTATTIQAPSQISQSVWHHVAVTVSRDPGGATVNLYIDGSTVGSPSSIPGLTTQSIANTEALIMGAIAQPQPPPVNYLNIYIDELEMFNRELLQSEVQSIYDADSFGKCKPSCVPPPANMTAWWPLDETSGPTANDIAGYANDGTWMNSPTPVPGKVAGALSFDGSNSVDVPDHTELNFDIFDFSIDLWIQTTDSSGTRTVLDKRTGSLPNATGYALYLYNGKPGLGLFDGVGYTNFTSPTFVADGSWHHVAATVDRDNSSGLLFYVDGNHVSTHDPTGRSGSLINTAPLVMARNLIDPGYTFAGTLDEVELFNRVLDSLEVYSIWYANSLGKCKSVSIEMVHDSAFVWHDGRTLRVTGDYTNNTERTLISDYMWYITNTPGPPKSMLLLTGDTLSTDCASAKVNLIGYIDSIEVRPSYSGDDSLSLYFYVQGYELLSEGIFCPPDSLEPPKFDFNDDLPKDIQYDPGKFAILLSGGWTSYYNFARYRNTLAAYHQYLTANAGYDPANIYTLYYEGLKTPSSQALPGGPYSHQWKATKDSIGFAAQEIKKSIQASPPGTIVTVFVWVFNHGLPNGDIALLSPNGISTTEFKDALQVVLDAGCDTLIVTMGQCFGGQPALELMTLDIKDRTKIYVTSNANEHVSSWSSKDGLTDPYLDEVLAQLIAGASNEVAMVEACKLYETHLWDMYNDPLIPSWYKPDILDAYEAKSIVWQRDRLYFDGDWTWIAGFPDGKFEFTFAAGGTSPIPCANTILWEKTGATLKNRAHWNYNIFGHPDFQTGNDLRIWCIAPSSSGIFRVNSQSWSGAFNLTTQSFMYADPCISDPSNGPLYAGFVLGFVDHVPWEFGEISVPLLAIDEINLPGFSLSEMPQELGPPGVTTLEATFTIQQYNEYWTNMVLVLDVADVITPGDLVITLPDSAKRDTTLYIDHEGRYTVHAGEIPDEPTNTIVFDASGADFTVDALGLNSLVDAFMVGDANGDWVINIADVVYLINYLFAGGDPPIPLEAGDANCDGTVNIADVVYLINYLFTGGPPPGCP